MPDDFVPTDKRARHQARQNAEAAEAALAAGNYAAALRLCRTVIVVGPDTDVGHKALQRASQLQTDPVAVYAGLGTLALYALAWFIALSRS